MKKAVQKWIEKRLRFISSKLWPTIYRFFSPRGVRVTEEDWDYLLILDACRHDAFEKLNTIPGRYEVKRSLGSSTPGWLRENFPSYYEDIAYVSANPFLSNIKLEGFKATDHFPLVEKVWDYGWDEELNTVPPEEVRKATLKVKEEAPEKRKIVHFLQPHAPWIGETRLSGEDLGVSFPTGLSWLGGVRKGSRKGLWGKLIEMDIDLNLVKKAYQDNLRLVLEEVEKLIEDLEGRIVISSDHGECFGEKFILEHPPGVYVEELVKVPWLVIDKNGG